MPNNKMTAEEKEHNTVCEGHVNISELLNSRNFDALIARLTTSKEEEVTSSTTFKVKTKATNGKKN